MSTDAKNILDFWFAVGTGEEGKPRPIWWSRSDAFDAEIRDRFGALHARASSSDLDDWRRQPESALALVILLDQFSRNLYRGTPAAFANDAHALVIAREAVSKDFDRALAPLYGQFFYLPFMHSEVLADQDRCVALFEAMTGLPDRENSLKAAHRHREIIARFGRFPHRNQALGRASTEAEVLFLKEPNSSF